MERKTVSNVEENLQATDTGYIVCLPSKNDTRPSANYCTARGQLKTLAQRASCDNIFFTQYDRVIGDYVNCSFIEEIHKDQVEGHYLPHHPIFKISATMPLCIVYKASSKPAGGKSLNDCLLTGLTLTAKLHYMLLSFWKGEFTCTADISKAFHHVKVNQQDRDYLKFLWVNKEQTNILTYRFKVVLFGVTCSPYLLQEILHTHFAENIMGHLFTDKFYVDNYMNTYDDRPSFIKDKVVLDQVMSEASMPLQK